MVGSGNHATKSHNLKKLAFQSNTTQSLLKNSTNNKNNNKHLSKQHSNLQTRMSSFNKPTSAADLAEFEALAGLATAAVKPTGMARWERKKAALKSTNTSGTTNTPSKRPRSETDTCTPSKVSLVVTT